jgi:hypothetical protein
MPIVEYVSIKINLDDEGYLINSELWTGADLILCR